MKHINYDRFLIAFMLIAAAATACYFILWIDNEEGYTTGFQYPLLNFIYTITAFIHILFIKAGVMNGWKGFFAGVFLSSVCYGIAIEFACIKYNIARTKTTAKSEIERPKSRIEL